MLNYRVFNLYCLFGTLSYLLQLFSALLEVFNLKVRDDDCNCKLR